MTILIATLLLFGAMLTIGGLFILGYVLGQMTSDDWLERPVTVEHYPRPSACERLAGCSRFYKEAGGPTYCMTHGEEVRRG